jgi:hypothetical protein
MQPDPIDPKPSYPLDSRRVALAVGYLFWVCLFFAVEGVARKHCRVQQDVGGSRRGCS